jgi:hypothetical protein
MTDTSVGIAIVLPFMNFNPALTYTSDIGREDTLIKNISFNNIIMDDNFGPPIKINIAENEGTRVREIRDIYFSGIHAQGPAGISIVGRASNHISNVKFSDCTFEITDYSVFGDRFYHGGSSRAKSHGVYPDMRFCDNVVFNNVEFRVKV